MKHLKIEDLTIKPLRITKKQQDRIMKIALPLIFLIAFTLVYGMITGQADYNNL